MLRLAVAPFLLTAGLVAQAEPAAAAKDPYRDAVRKSIAWLATQAIALEETPDAILFPASEGRKRPGAVPIYGGNAGILIFLDNAAAVLGDPTAKDLAARLAKGIESRRKQTAEGHVTFVQPSMREGAASLYLGDAGVGAAFLARARLNDDKAALKVATEIGDALIARAKREGDQMWWDRQVEMIYGAAGTVLFLLDLADATAAPRFKDAAHAAGRWLIAQAKVSAGKTQAGDEQRLLHWRWAAGGNAPYVNFSHGTAGVAYALAWLGHVAQDAACLGAAKDGTAWLDGLAKHEAGGTVWPVIDGRETTMGGWCHGPPGTVRLYLLLHQITGDKAYLDTAIAGARWVMAQAPQPEPGAEAPKFPPSFCCGVAGVVDSFCDLYRATGDQQFAAFARRAGEYLLAGAKPVGDGLRWPQGATHQGSNDSFPTDLMLGTPGEALALLRLATLDQKVDPVRHLPDRRVGK